MIIKSVNDTIICVPEESAGGIKQEVRGGFVNIVQKIELIPLTVVYSTEDGSVSSGDCVYVRESSIMTQRWAKDILRIDGERVILVPKTEVVATLKKE